MQTLLVIENQNLDILKKLLNKIDFVVTVFVQDGLSAFEWCDSNYVDVILLNLPKLEALKFVEEVRTVENSQYIPIIMMASSRDLDMKIKALELNVIDFVSIPIDQLELINRIKNASKMREHQKKHLSDLKKIYELQKLEAVNCLTAGVAHEFNNLLLAIQGYADLNQLTSQDIKQAFPSNNTADDLSEDCLANSLQISTAVAKGKKLVEKMLLYCQRNEMQQNSYLDLVDFLEEDISNLQEMLPKVSFNFKIDQANIKLPVYIDNINSNNLAQILWNICVNARDAFQDGKGTIDILLTQVNDEFNCSCCSVDFYGNFIKLDIRDNGLGISEEILPRIFDPFFTTKEVGSGTGLGLSVVAGLIHNSQGHIQVTSSPDIETTFSLFFPYKHHKPC